MRCRFTSLDPIMGHIPKKQGRRERWDVRGISGWVGDAADPVASRAARWEESKGGPAARGRGG